MIENCPAIQKQDRRFLLPDGFYRLCAPGQTARAFCTSRTTGIYGPLDGTGVQNRDAPVALGKRGNRGKNAKQKKRQQWKEKPFHFNPLSMQYPIFCNARSIWRIFLPFCISERNTFMEGVKCKLPFSVKADMGKKRRRTEGMTCGENGWRPEIFLRLKIRIINDKKTKEKGIG